MVTGVFYLTRVSKFCIKSTFLHLVSCWSVGSAKNLSKLNSYLPWKDANQNWERIQNGYLPTLKEDTRDGTRKETILHPVQRNLDRSRALPNSKEGPVLQPYCLKYLLIVTIAVEICIRVSLAQNNNQTNTYFPNRMEPKDSSRFPTWHSHWAEDIHQIPLIGPPLWDELGLIPPDMSPAGFVSLGLQNVRHS